MSDELERLRAELAAANKRSNTHYELLVIALRERNAATANVSKLRKALEPFVASAYRADRDGIADIDAAYVVVAHLRHARAVLEETGGGDG